MMKKILQHKEVILLIVILLLAAFLRLYRIGDYMTFLGDEGRDVIIVRDLLHGNLTFLGPRASAGDFFTGPVYYYMMAPFLLLFNYNPVGPAVMVALLSVATVYLIYKIGKEFFGTLAGISAALLYSISPVVITYSHSSWNPNPMPFFTLLLLYILYKGVTQRKLGLFLWVGVLYGIAFQLHYIEVFTGIIMALFVFIGSLFWQKEKLLTVSKQYGLILLGFLLGLSPFLAFEIKNGFPNSTAIFKFILFGSGEASTVANYSYLGTVFSVFFRVFADLVWYFPQGGRLPQTPTLLVLAWTVIVWVSAILSLLFLTRVKNKYVQLLFFLWIGLGVLLFGFYKRPIYDYYFQFMFPVPFLLVGNGLQKAFASKRAYPYGKYLALFSLAFLVVINLSGYPFQFEPNRQKHQMEYVSDFVLSKTDNKPFNFALLSGNNSDHAYKYFFDIEDRSPVTIQNTVIDPRRETVTDQLLVVCEYPDCQPLGHPLFEIAGFGRAQVAGEWVLYKDLIKVIKLTPYEEASPSN